MSLKKNMKKKCLYVLKEKKRAIPMLLIEFSGHFSGHFFSNRTLNNVHSRSAFARARTCLTLSELSGRTLICLRKEEKLSPHLELPIYLILKSGWSGSIV